MVHIPALRVLSLNVALMTILPSSWQSTSSNWWRTR